MTPLRQHMIAALQRSGKGERTQQASVREVRLLAQFYGQSPDLLSEQELQHSLHEGLSLQVSDIDGQRLLVHVHRGKGAKDHYVPLPQETLALLRVSWLTHRHKTWLFPATGRDQKRSPTATYPMSRRSIQGAFRTAEQRAGITKTGMAIHSLRHSSATHLREAGVNLRLMQLYLGHTRLETTMLSLHLTHKGHEDAYARLNSCMRGLPS
jgi:integrase/recombinase XerD